jgi:hypothetical protein
MSTSPDTIQCCFREVLAYYFFDAYCVIHVLESLCHKPAMRFELVCAIGAF